jgi:tellurite resistance protein TehA-like permease
MNASSIIQNPNLRGSLFMVFAMAGFSLQDMLLKRVMDQMPVGQMLILFGTGGMIVFAILAY